MEEAAVAGLRRSGSGEQQELRKPRSHSHALKSSMATRYPATWPTDYSLLCFPSWSPVRRLCVRLVSDERFDAVVLVAIIVSSVCLALDVPRLDPTSPLAMTLRQLDSVWLVLFASEMLAKVIAFGFIFSEEAYVKNPWNLLDLVIVTVSLLVLLAEVFPPLAGLKTLRVLRVLRPLRLLSRNPGMKLVITSLFKGCRSQGRGTPYFEVVDRRGESCMMADASPRESNIYFPGAPNEARQERRV